MGYLTNFRLIVGVNSDIEGINDALNEISGYTFEQECEDTLLSESIKWYDHELDMRTLSLRYPDVVFELNGAGEESGDIWIEYYKNGKMQREEARIEFDPYDEGKLK